MSGGKLNPGRITEPYCIYRPKRPGSRLRRSVRVLYVSTAGGPKWCGLPDRNGQSHIRLPLLLSFPIFLHTRSLWGCFSFHSWQCHQSWRTEQHVAGQTAGEAVSRWQTPPMCQTLTARFYLTLEGHSTSLTFFTQDRWSWFHIAIWSRQ